MQHVAGATVDMIFAEQSPGVAAGSAGGQEDEDGKQPAPKASVGMALCGQAVVWHGT